MHDELWAGVDLKIQHASFFLQEMSNAIQPPPHSHMNAVLASTRAVVVTPWQQSFYAHFDAFLAMTRSVPEIIQACFGADLSTRQMRDWFDGLPPPERDRRKKFSDKFKTRYDEFRELPLSNARNISMHRSGFPSVEVSITGMFGITHIGTPTRRVPSSETRPIVTDEDAQFAWLQKPMPVQPKWTDFKIDGRPLFPECKDYFQKANNVVSEARAIAQQVHGNATLTPPPQ